MDKKLEARLKIPIDPWWTRTLSSSEKSLFQLRLTKATLTPLPLKRAAVSCLSSKNRPAWISLALLTLNSSGSDKTLSRIWTLSFPTQGRCSPNQPRVARAFSGFLVVYGGKERPFRTEELLA
jgi:hypothetical protein